MENSSSAFFLFASVQGSRPPAIRTGQDLPSPVGGTTFLGKNFEYLEDSRPKGRGDFEERCIIRPLSLILGRHAKNRKRVVIMLKKEEGKADIKIKKYRIDWAGLPKRVITTAEALVSIFHSCWKNSNQKWPPAMGTYTHWGWFFNWTRIVAMLLHHGNQVFKI
ncbi:MAG: hypothetical protein WCG27_03580 [Pseudomonadota bacterium]